MARSTSRSRRLSRSRCWAVRTMVVWRSGFRARRGMLDGFPSRIGCRVRHNRRRKRLRCPPRGVRRHLVEVRRRPAMPTPRPGSCSGRAMGRATHGVRIAERRSPAFAARNMAHSTSLSHGVSASRCCVALRTAAVGPSGGWKGNALQAWKRVGSPRSFLCRRRSRIAELSTNRLRRLALAIGRQRFFSHSVSTKGCWRRPSHWALRSRRQRCQS
mmetsp:Transcript_121890/g.344767  ORF Transcript_121890/g.344767 Transcript_121890/m.344767 type:complete len:215 (-) Transcript_121890:282-926(-)